MQKSESIKELAIALCKFQSQVEKIKKTAENPFFKSKYATLADILDVIRQPLTDAGLSFVQFPKGKHELETMLMHTSGEWMTETYEMTPTKNDPQGLGSVITYQRRYALGAILGLNIDTDDDGNKASEPVKTQSKQAPQPQQKAQPKATEKPVLTDDKFQKAVEYLLSGHTMSELKTKYVVSQDMEFKLDLAVEPK